jgi:hypothetical protein
MSYIKPEVLPAGDALVLVLHAGTQKYTVYGDGQTDTMACQPSEDEE